MKSQKGSAILTHTGENGRFESYADMRILTHIRKDGVLGTPKSDLYSKNTNRTKVEDK